MGMFDSFLHPEKGYEAAEEQARKAWQEAQGYQKPYWQQGLDQYGRLNEATGALLNPAELESKWASGYQQSPYAQRMLQMNQNSGLDAASSMGLMGSSGALQNIQQGAGDIVAKDRQNYLNDLMQKYMTGIGLGQNLYGTGANMAGELGQEAIGHGNTMGGLEYGRRNAPGQLFDNMLQGGAMAAMNYFAPGSGALMGNSGFTGNRFNQGVPPYMQNAIYGQGQ